MASEGTVTQRTFTRLRFSDDDLEAGFSDYYFAHALPFTRLAIVLAIVLYALFGILDLFIVPSVARWIWVIRYAVFCPVALGVLALTFTRWFKPIMQPVLSGLAAVCGLGIVAMIAIADASGGYLYYAGLLLVIPWAYAVLQLRFVYATVACLAIMAGYELVAILMKPTPLEILVNNNFFFISALIIAMVAGYTIERGLRTEFLQRRLIESQRAELAAHNVHLDSALQASLEEVRRQADELQASRARIVTAADAERRRVERNLHDGAQQHLIALKTRLTLAKKLAVRDAQKAQDLITKLEGEATETLETLRDLARGIYPPLLAEHGLKSALEAQARKAPFPVDVQVDGISRYQQEVEAAVYFCCLEALQNVCKYADASSAVMEVAERDGTLEFSVRDDGTGFDPATTSPGAGLQNMVDRIQALGGDLRIDSSPGQGATVSGRIPTATTAAVTAPDAR